MKLLIATPLYPPELGGPATYVKVIEDMLPAYGVEVQVIKFSEVRKYPNGIRQFIFFTKVLTKGWKADIIYALDTVSVGWPTYFANLFLRKKFVVRIPGDHIWEQGSQRFGVTGNLESIPQYSWKWPLYLTFLRLLQQCVVRGAAYNVVPSEYLKKIVVTWGAKEKNIVVIYNSAELPKAMTEGTLSQAMVAKNSIITVGRLVPWKGIDGLILAVAEVKKELPEVTLTIVGEGPEKERLEEQGRKLLGSSVIFTGALSHDQALEHMQQAGIFVLNSSYEGLSHTLIEALSLGSAIVASDAGGNPELIEDSVNGLTVPVGNTEALAKAITRLLTDQTLCARLQARAIESSKRFSVDEMVTKTNTLLQTLV